MPTRDAIEDFAYASFLLAAGTRTALYGIVPYYFRDPAERGFLFTEHLVMANAEGLGKTWRVVLGKCCWISAGPSMAP